jgi:hypothetical protein
VRGYVRLKWNRGIYSLTGFADGIDDLLVIHLNSFRPKFLCHAHTPRDLAWPHLLHFS